MNKIVHVLGHQHYLRRFTMQDPRRRRLQSEGFQCGEKIEKDDVLTFVIFHCALPLPCNASLEFRCRDSSCGALEAGEEAATLAEEDYSVDPNFFDEGYSMAGSTGFKVWTGSRLLIETLVWPQNTDCERLKEIQQCIRNGARMIELGSGVGVVGTYLSAIGSQVILTDLPTLVENAIDYNLRRNKNIIDSTTTSTSSSTIENNVSCPTWLGADLIRIGNGWAAATPLDWTQPLHEQLTHDQSSSIEFIIASDVIFLASMLNSLLNTVNSLFQASVSNNPSFILSFQRRDALDGEESVAFTTVSGFAAEIHRRGWSLDCLAWRPVTVRKETKDGLVVNEESEVFVFEIKP